ncbi:hypothetical protein HMPREF1988_02243, partial [Porphyromonas gingivalis F0185]
RLKIFSLFPPSPYFSKVSFFRCSLPEYSEYSEKKILERKKVRAVFADCTDF